MEMSSRRNKITVFPPMRGSVYHPLRSRLPVDTTVVVKRSATGPVLTGVIRQIMQDPQNRKRFRYFIRSKHKSAQYYEEIWEDDFLNDFVNGTRWRTRVLPHRPSCSSTHSDVYLMLTPNQAKKKWPPFTCRMFDFTRGPTERKTIIAGFRERCKDESFVAQQQAFLLAMDKAARTYVQKLPDSMKPPRFGWAHWVPNRWGEPWHLFQLVALLVHTNGTGDDIVKMSIGELFRHRSSVCSGRKFFDNPHTFARDPQKARFSWD
jgi:hypothetical protein